jgi:hypothetical protein
VQIRVALSFEIDLCVSVGASRLERHNDTKGVGGGSIHSGHGRLSNELTGMHGGTIQRVTPKAIWDWVFNNSSSFERIKLFVKG